MLCKDVSALCSVPGGDDCCQLTIITRSLSEQQTRRVCMRIGGMSANDMAQIVQCSAHPPTGPLVDGLALPTEAFLVIRSIKRWPERGCRASFCCVLTAMPVAVGRWESGGLCSRG